MAVQYLLHLIPLFLCDNRLMSALIQLLAHVAGVGTVNDLSGGFIDEVNGDVLYLGAIENIVHSTVH